MHRFLSKVFEETITASRAIGTSTNDAKARISCHMLRWGLYRKL